MITQSRLEGANSSRPCLATAHDLRKEGDKTLQWNVAMGNTKEWARVKMQV